MPKYEGSFHVKSCKAPHLTPVDLLKFCQVNVSIKKWKSWKLLALYHIQFRNDHLKYATFSLDTEPLKFLALWNCFYSAIFNRKHLKFGLVIHFHKIISKTMYLAKNFMKQVCVWGLKLLKLLLWCFSFNFQRAISWERKIQICSMG